MNIRPSEATVVVHFSAARVDRVDEFDDVSIGFDEGGRIVDVAVRTRNAPARLDFVDSEHDGFPGSVTYDAEANAIGVGLSTTPYEDSEEILPDLIVDRDVDGFVSALEFLNVSHHLSSDAMSGVRKRAALL